MNILIIIIGILSTCISYIININLNRGPVLASAIVTLIAGLFLPMIFKDGAVLAAVAATGSYAAMVSKERFPRLLDMLFVGTLVGVVSILAQNVFVGVGGKLGTMAAISGLTYLGIIKVKNKIES